MAISLPSTKLRRLASTFLRRFRDDQSGSVAIVFAVAASVATMLAGAAIDYSRGVGAQAKLQTAVDQALLAALQSPAGQQATQATAVLQAALSQSGMSVSWSQQPTVNADGSVSGAVTATLPTTALQIARINQMTLSASAKVKQSVIAAQSPANVTFTLTGASGWYWKQVDLFVHQPGAASNTLIASYVYQPTNLYSGGTGTVAAQFLTGPGGTMVSGAVDTPVSLGSTYDNAYLRMTVYSDGCGPGYAPQHPDFASNSSYWNPFVCMAVGSTWTSSSTKYVCSGGRCGYQTVTTTNTVSKTATPVYYATNDPTTSHNLFVNGVELPNNSTPAFFSLFNCGGTTSHDWEDTPWANPLPGSWSQQDIHFTVATTCASNSNIASTTAGVLLQ